MGSSCVAQAKLQLETLDEDESTTSTLVAKTHLSEQEIKILQISWGLAKQRSYIGRCILLNCIRRKPTLATVFSIPANIPPEELSMKQEVKDQGDRIEAFLENIVKSLGFVSYGAIRDRCTQIGSVHFQRGVDFNAENWSAFREAILEEVLDENARKTIEKEASLKGINPNRAWVVLVGAVLKEMQDGFKIEKEKNKK